MRDATRLLLDTAERGLEAAESLAASRLYARASFEPEQLFDEKQMEELRNCCHRVTAFVKSHLR